VKDLFNTKEEEDERKTQADLTLSVTPQQHAPQTQLWLALHCGPGRPMGFTPRTSQCHIKD